VTTPRLDTRSAPDVLLQVAGQLGGAVKAALPWNSYRAAVEEAAAQLAGRPNGSVAPAQPGPEYFWVKLLQQGGWWETSAASPAAAPSARPTLPAQPPAPAFAGSAEEYPYHLHVFPSAAILEGELAHLPWLQGLPDPTTTAVWSTWIEVHPDTAARLGVVEGDYVAVTSSVGSVEVPVYVYPGTQPDVVAMPLGQGHTAFGRWAKDRGANPLTILAPQIDAETGSLAYEATRVRLAKAARTRRLPKFEGVVQPFKPEELPLVLGQEGEATGAGH
jgi:anaerobic selenocysteine-containing dehydrogenase